MYDEKQVKALGYYFSTVPPVVLYGYHFVADSILWLLLIQELVGNRSYPRIPNLIQ